MVMEMDVVGKEALSTPNRTGNKDRSTQDGYWYLESGFSKTDDKAKIIVAFYEIVLPALMKIGWTKALRSCR